jgi:hypothetical protein
LLNFNRFGQINELAAANQAYLGEYDRQKESDNFTAAKFLAQRSFDVFGLSSDVRNLEVPVSSNTSDSIFRFVPRL